MRIIVLGLMAAGSFLMLSADTRAQVEPGPNWCSTGTVVPVADFTFYPELLARGGLARLAVGSIEVISDEELNDKGIFDDDYPPYPEEQQIAVGELALSGASQHCAQYATANSEEGEAGSVVAVIDDLDAVVQANLVGSYNPNLSLTGTCLRCETN